MILELLLAAAAGLADVAEELEALLGGCAGNGRGGRGRVPRARSRCEGCGVKGPAVATLQDGDLQGAPSPPHPQHLSRSLFTFSQIQATSGRLPAPVFTALGTYWFWQGLVWVTPSFCSVRG